MIDPRDLLRSHLTDIPAYGLVDETAPVKLNQNESPYDVPAEVKEEVFRRLRTRPWNRYAQQVPDRVARLVAEQNDWPPEGVVLGGGSNLLLELIVFAAVGQDTCVLSPTPCFALYGLLSRLAGARLVEVPFADQFAYDSRLWCAAIEKHAPGLVLLCVPNNPTGSFMDRGGVHAVVDAADCLVVLDEAYREFAGEDRRDLLPDFPRLVLVRTFSKAFSGAGIRLGYLLAHPDVARELRKLVPPFNVNLLTATCAEVMLERPELWTAKVAAILEERGRLVAELAAVAGVETVPTRANFFLLRSPLGAEDLAARLVDHGILVRVLRGAGLERTVRVNVGTPEENDAFLAALRNVLGHVWPKGERE